MCKEMDQNWSKSRCWGNVLFKNTKKTLPKPRIKTLLCLEIVATAKPRNELFWLLKDVFFIPTSHNIIHKHVWIIKTNKKTSKSSKRYKNINLKQIIYSHNMDSKLVFWTNFVHEQT